MAAKKQQRGPTAMRTGDDEYTKEERKLIIDYIDDELTIPQLKDFLRQKELPLGGNKSDLIATIGEAIRQGEVTYVELLDLLDEVLPWGAQHVFLFGEPALSASKVAVFRDEKAFAKHLSDNSASRTFKARLPLVLPEKLTLSSIAHSGSSIRITAIERREGFMRDESMDKEGKTERGERIELRAFVEKTTRGLIIFEWDVVQNFAMLQITRLPSGGDYTKAQLRFAKLVSKWLDVSKFPFVNIRRAISALHTEHIDNEDDSRVKPHGVGYNTMDGGRVEARSATATVSLSADPVAAESVDRVRTEGVGRMGNFYWRKVPGLKKTKSGEEGRGVHVKLLGEAKRIHFHTSNTEETVRHVLNDIRNASV